MYFFRLGDADTRAVWPLEDQTASGGCSTIELQDENGGQAVKPPAPFPVGLNYQGYQLRGLIWFKFDVGAWTN